MQVVRKTDRLVWSFATAGRRRFEEAKSPRSRVITTRFERQDAGWCGGPFEIRVGFAMGRKAEMDVLVSQGAVGFEVISGVAWGTWCTDVKVTGLEARL